MFGINAVIGRTAYVVVGVKGEEGKKKKKKKKAYHDGGLHLNLFLFSS